MNRLRHALAVIEDRTHDHEIAVEGGMFGVRVVCKCGWEGPEHSPIYGHFPHGTSQTMVDEAVAHAGVADPPIWRREI